MWDELLKQLRRYESAVITGLGDDGYPFSWRCTPHPDQMQKVLRIDVPPGAPVTPGPAGLLCHRHDERMWNQRSFLVRGRLSSAGGWAFVPERLIPGEGARGLLGTLSILRKARRAAREYLQRRGIPPPPIPWAAINEDKAQLLREK